MSLPFQFKADDMIKAGRAKQEDINLISQWLSESPLPVLQDEFIVLFLISCRHDVYKVKHTIENYFRIRNKNPRIFSNCDLKRDDLKNALNVMNFCVVPNRFKNNTAILLFSLNDTNYRHINVPNVLQIVCMVYFVSQISDPPDDVIVVFDSKGFGFMHLTCVTLGPFMGYFEYIQDALPLKISKIHVLNTNYIFERLLSLCQTFIKSELMEIVLDQKIEMHSPGMTMEEFQRKWIPASHLPEEYGGHLDSVKQLRDETVDKLHKMQEFFMEEEKIRSGF